MFEGCKKTKWDKDWRNYCFCKTLYKDYALRAHWGASGACDIANVSLEIQARHSNTERWSLTFSWPFLLGKNGGQTASSEKGWTFYICVKPTTQLSGRWRERRAFKWKKSDKALSPMSSSNERGGSLPELRAEWVKKSQRHERYRQQNNTTYF